MGNEQKIRHDELEKLIDFSGHFISQPTDKKDIEITEITLQELKTDV
jgi:hypothetical protein